MLSSGSNPNLGEYDLSGPPARNVTGWPPHYVDLPSSTQPGDNRDELLSFWHLLRRRKFLMVSLGMIGLLIGLLFSLPKPIVYQAEVTMEVQLFNENFLGIGQVDPQAGSYSPTQENIRTFMQVLQSGALRREVVSRLNRELVPSLPPVPGGTFYAMRGYLLRKIWKKVPDDPVDAMRQGLAMASSSVRAGNLGGTRIVSVSCQSTHPQIAAAFVNTLANEFIEQSMADRLKNLQRTTAWMNVQVQELKVKLEKSEEDLRQFLRARGGFAAVSSDGDPAVQGRLQQMQDALSAARSERVSRQSLYEASKSSQLDSFVVTPEGSSLRGLHSKLAGLRQQLAELTQKFTSAHPKVLELNPQIADIEAEISRERQFIANKLLRDVEDAQRREHLQAEAYQREFRKLSGSTDDMMEYMLLKRMVDSNRQLYQAMLQNVNHAGLATAIPTNNLRIVDPAEVNLRPESTRNWVLNIALGLFTGILSGIAFVIFHFKANQRLEMPGDAPNLLNLPELGVIPSSENNTKRRLLPTLSRRSQEVDVAGEVQSGVETVAWNQKPSWLVESFRGTVASLVTPFKQGPAPRVLTVTSPRPKEGKSTVVSNLAISLADIGRRVLLVDGDFRSPRLHEIFRLSNSWGLSDLVQEQASINSYPLESLVRSTEVPGLFLLPTGPPIPSMSRILYSMRFQQLLERMRNEFDHILIDTPPVLMFADARILGRMSDGVILVLRAGGTDRTSALLARQRLTEDGIIVLGTILNDWDFKRDTAGHYGYNEKNKYFTSI